MKGRWFRFYEEALNNVKVQTLPDRVFKLWVNLLCVASSNDGTVSRDLNEIAFATRRMDGDLAGDVQALVDAHLFDEVKGKLRPHNWDERQFVGNSSTERVKEFRKRKKQHSETRSETHETVSRNAPDTDSDTETESETDSDQRIERSPVPASQSVVVPLQPDRAPVKGSRGTRLPPDFQPDPATFTDPQFNPLTPERRRREVAAFRDYWSARAGQQGVKLDWQATWRNWLRNQIKFEGGNRGAAHSGRGALEQGDDFLDGIIPSNDHRGR